MSYAVYLSTVHYIIKNMENKIENFTDLRAWKEGHILVLMVYKATESFPQKETFGLVSQMRRAAVSITSNIAEGFSRRTAKDKCQFYSISSGSITELQDQLIISKDVRYLSAKDFDNIYHQSIEVKKIVSGLKRIYHD